MKKLRGFYQQIYAYMTFNEVIADFLDVTGVEFPFIIGVNTIFDEFWIAIMPTPPDFWPSNGWFNPTTIRPNGYGDHSPASPPSQTQNYMIGPTSSEQLSDFLEMTAPTTLWSFNIAMEYIANSPYSQ
jgi:hypothetical protein